MEARPVMNDLTGCEVLLYVAQAKLPLHLFGNKPVP